VQEDLIIFGSTKLVIVHPGDQRLERVGTMENDGNGGARAPRRIPLSLSDLRRRRDAGATDEGRPVFVPKDERKTSQAPPVSPPSRAYTLASSSSEDQLLSIPPRLSPQMPQQCPALRRPPHRQHMPPTNYVSCEFVPGRNMSRTVGKRPRTPEIIAAEAAKYPLLERDTKEREAIRRHYMPEEGGQDDRSRYQQSLSKHSEKIRFRFDWAAEEDTYIDAQDSIYNKLRSETLASSLQFGRGGRGGMHDACRSFDDGDIKRISGAAVASLRDTRHWSDKKRSEMTERDWAIFREDHAISVRGGALATARPARNWDESGLPCDIQRLVRDVAGYNEPSSIQMATIPVALRRRDLIGLAETGSGKTAAFVLPMVVHIRQMPTMTADLASQGPYALVLAPTRELVLQIEAETRKFAAPLGLRVTAVIGGQGLEEQGMVLQAGCEIVVCTPGRMVDLLSRRLAALGNCNYLILDEADRMIDMGFEPQVQEILASMPAVDRRQVQKNRKERQEGLHGAREISFGVSAVADDLRIGMVDDGHDDGADEDEMNVSRQTFMFSATMSPSIERLARDYLSHPLIITIGETGKAADAVDQRVEYLTSEGQKRERMVSLIRTLEPPVIVFANTKRGCEEVARLIESRTGIRPVVLHSGKSQDQREESLEGFKASRFGVLVATDVLGRGIDVKGVNHVVNYELPKTIAPYTHRIGRTGRAGRKGVAWSLATAADDDIFGDLKQHLEQSGANVPPVIARFDSGRSSLRNIID
jgi:ATP-dependent RNA helicase DDX23/PRP28